MPHDPSEFFLICWFGTQETFIIIINIENSIFVETIFLFYRIICVIREGAGSAKHLETDSISGHREHSCATCRRTYNQGIGAK